MTIDQENKASFIAQLNLELLRYDPEMYDFLKSTPIEYDVVDGEEHLFCSEVDSTVDVTGYTFAGLMNSFSYFILEYLS